MGKVNAAIWGRWLAMAHESRAAAVQSQEAGRPRSAASRFYYTAYQAASALLLYCRLTPPTISGQRRESWSHGEMPGLLHAVLQRFVPDRRRCGDVRAKLGGLYKVRVSADYISADDISPATLAAVRRDAGYILKLAQDIIGER